MVNLDLDAVVDGGKVDDVLAGGKIKLANELGEAFNSDLSVKLGKLAQDLVDDDSLELIGEAVVSFLDLGNEWVALVSKGKDINAILNEEEEGLDLRGAEVEDVVSEDVGNEFSSGRNGDFRAHKGDSFRSGFFRKVLFVGGGGNCED